MSNFRRPTIEESFNLKPKHPVNPTDINWKSVMIFAGVTIVVTAATSYIIYRVTEKNNNQWALIADQNAQEHLEAIVNKEKRITQLEEQLRQEKLHNTAQVTSPIGATSFMRITAEENKLAEDNPPVDRNTNISNTQ